jgi:hypothetical protein
MLQLVAPLIHAHKNEQFNVASSFHLPEFEQVNALLEKDASLMVAPSFHEGEIVVVSSGVKENQRRFLSNDDFKIFALFSFLLMLAKFPEKTHQFFVNTTFIKRFCVFSLAIPRAPPIFSF